MIAALYVETDGCYFGLRNVDPYDVLRDARFYKGPYAVVAHPPCARWGRYWSGGPSAKVRRARGDDGGCFANALMAVRRWGGVLEHPEASSAFRAFGLHPPSREGGWQRADEFGGFVCCVEQGHYGHPARKATWLYANGILPLPRLLRGPSTGRRLDEGFHSAEERAAARASGVSAIPRLSTTENRATPLAFRDLLIAMAETVRK